MICLPWGIYSVLNFTNLISYLLFCSFAFINSVERPTLLTKVSDYIPQILSFIQKLLSEGLAYTTEDGSVYFNLKAYSDKNFLYGKLKPPDSLKISDGGKKFSSDFALWKAAKSATEPSWKPSWGGNGRPGWHVSKFIIASIIV